MVMLANEAVLERLSFSEDLAAQAERLRHSTVVVRGRGPGAGSGVIWASNGLIVTNAHVARGPRAAVELSDGRSLLAVVKARDPRRDLAALSVNASALPAADVGDSERLRVGDLVLAVGNPLGLVGAFKSGIIHAVGSRDGPGGQKWVQADVRLEPGYSGGPLADARGRVIGINSMVAGGLALAVPSNAVADFLGGTGRRTRRPYLGVTLRPVLVRQGEERMGGLLVLEVEQGSPAQSAGLAVGDVLTAAGGHTLNEPQDLARALEDAGPTGRLGLNLVRAGQRVARDVLLGVQGS